jgi:hypothetical protein
MKGGTTDRRAGVSTRQSINTDTAFKGSIRPNAFDYHHARLYTIKYFNMKVHAPTLIAERNTCAVRCAELAGIIRM